MTFLKNAGRVGLVLAMLGIAGCAATPSESDMAATDRTEGLNREFHKFNVGLDTVVIRPLAVTYDTVSPDVVKLMVTNEFNYLSLPKDFANHLLQGNIHDALQTLGRFTLNTIIGAVGLLDPATEFGLPEKDTDFGVTLAKLGAGEGNYLVLPVLGPSTVRDAVGRLVDNAFAPTSYLGLTLAEKGAVYGGQAVEFRDRNMEPIDEVLYNSEDSYVSLRSVYLQHRRSKVSGGDAQTEGLPDIFNQKN